MSSAHVHSNPSDKDWPVTVCLSTNAAHTLAMYLSVQEHNSVGIPEYLHELRIHLDAKLVGDPTSRTEVRNNGGDTAKEHKPRWNPPTSDPTTMTSAQENVRPL